MGVIKMSQPNKKGFMDAFEAVAEKTLLPIAMKLNAQRHLAALRDAFILVLPLTMAGSFVVMINCAFFSADGFVYDKLFLGKLFPGLTEIAPVLWPANNGTLNILSIFVVFLITRNLVKTLGGDDLLGGLLGLSAFFILYPDLAKTAGGFFGTKGIFVAMLIGFIVGEGFARLSKVEKLQVKMPDSVPPAVSRSFKVLLPIFIMIFIVTIANWAFTKVNADGLFPIIYSAIQKPLEGLGQNIGTLIILLTLSNLLWIFGIHGPNTINAIQSAMFEGPKNDNLAFASAHGTAWGAPNEITWQLADAFANMGGSGMTIGLIIAIILVSKRDDFKSLNKLAIGPAIFNINEPIIFGLPIVLNPIFIIPFVCIPAINVFIGYMCIHLGVIPPLAYNVPWTTPGPLAAFFATQEPVALLISLVLVAISVVGYLPFVMAANKQNQQ
jgi:PTS system cellobiose-specific IIC component